MAGMPAKFTGTVKISFKYIDTGFEELDQSRLPKLIELKYSSMTDAANALGGVDTIRSLFFNFQKELYGVQPEKGYVQN